MSAYNWIIVTTRCPACNRQVELRCQTHIASDYGGDQTGRFHDREYHLGEPLRWWRKGHQKFQAWRANGRVGEFNQGETDSESCYTSCPACSTDLYAVIEFDGPRSVAVTDIGLEDNWPKDY